MKTIMIIAGESSGELYGSFLAMALRQKWPDVHIMGMGGTRMHEAGVNIIAPTSDALGLVEAVSAYSKIKDAFQKILNALKTSNPQVIVLIDYPDFNLRVAKEARVRGVKILYYVSPQVWAWRSGRVKKIASAVDRMAVILPFEEEIYRKAGLPCEFVGHPILEEIEGILADFGQETSVTERKARMKTELGFYPDKPLLAILPGSRPNELSRLLPLAVDVVRRWKAEFRDYQICIPLAPNTDEKKYSSYFEKLRQEGISIQKGQSVKVLAASDLAVVASGTATLQTAFLEVPMVVIYKLSPVTYQLGKRIIKVKHISLVNILSGKEIVRELLQDMANPEEITNELKKIVSDKGYRENMLHHFKQIKEPFLGKKTSERVAEMVEEIAGERV